MITQAAGKHSGVRRGLSLNRHMSAMGVLVKVRGRGSEAGVRVPVSVIFRDRRLNEAAGAADATRGCWWRQSADNGGILGHKEVPRDCPRPTHYPSRAAPAASTRLSLVFRRTLLRRDLSAVARWIRRLPWRQVLLTNTETGFPLH